ncbi:MAG: trypsin-like peptidase domain-containing protein [Streptosporangiaceae bacterium]
MSDQPVRGAVSSPAPPDQGFSGSTGPPAEGLPAPRESLPAAGGAPGYPGAQEGTSDFGRFDWFAESEHFGEPEERRARWHARAWLPGSPRDSRHSGGRQPGAGDSAGGDPRGPRRHWLRGWRVAAVAIGLALACTLAGGVIGGVVALRNVSDQTDPTYSLGTVPPALTSQPGGSVAGVAARDTPGVVMIKVNNGQGTGSGFIIKGGYIVTDNHVVTLDGLVRNASLRVYFSNGRSAAGHVVGRDPYSDIAVIKVTGVTSLPALSLGNSAGLAVGDPVVAIGSPLGLSDTVTSGIVSAVNRPVQPGSASGTTPQVFFDAIQTDAPINPGNSGGPLVNARGQVIGIDAAIDTLGDDPITGTQGGSIGLGFAIPIDQARRVIVQLIRTGQATHSVIGATLNESYAGNGAQIMTTVTGGAPSVSPGGPAARAGLRAGDVITQLAGRPVSSAYSLLDAVRSLPPGATVAVDFRRQGQAHRARLTLGSAGS